MAIKNINIFSTYSTRENRVTASILAVIQALSLGRIERLLGAILEESVQLVRFQNQFTGGGPGVPDALIQSSCRLLVETKLKANSVDPEQLKRHLTKLDEATESFKILIVLTPDLQQPAIFDKINNRQLAWASFANLDQAIDDLLKDPREVVSEREAFLLRELQAMLLNEGLLANTKDVVIVAARVAWPEYQKYHVYVCQPDRSFKQVARIGFYSQGKIHPLIPKIIDVHEHVEFVPEQYDGKLRSLIEKLLEETTRKQGEAYKVVFLSAPDSTETVNLGQPIVNDLQTESGGITAFTQNQRYMTLERLRNAKTTSVLVRD